MLDLHRLCRDMDDRKSPLRRQADTLVQKMQRRRGSIRPNPYLSHPAPPPGRF